MADESRNAYTLSSKEMQDIETIEEAEREEIAISGNNPSSNENNKNGTETAFPDALKLYLSEISRYPLLSQEEEIKLGWEVKEGSRYAENQLVLHNLRLVVSIAKKYVTPERNIMDMIQEGNEGLMRAAHKFDVEKGYRFSTYATWWIRQGIQRFACSDTTIRKPVHYYEKVAKIRKIRLELERENESSISRKELADFIGMSEEELSEIEYRTQRVSSLNSYVGEDEDNQTELGDMVADNRTNPEEEAEKNVLKSSLQAILNDRLSDREREVLEKRYGLNGHQIMTLNEIGIEHGISRERVRQIEWTALRKLQRSKDVQKMREYAL